MKSKAQVKKTDLESKSPILQNQKNKNSTCKVVCFNEEKVNKAKRSLASDRKLEELVGLYSALGNITRLKIIFALSKGELCVCDIANVLDLSIPATSHQLKHLYGHKLLKNRNDGKMVYYSLNSEHLVSILKKDVQFIEDELVG